MKAISLFSSGGIADTVLDKVGIDILLSNELIEDRASLYKHNFPSSDIVVGGIRELKEKLIKKTRNLLSGEELGLLLATPPCQGMSKNAQGKLLREIREGRRPEIDPRNRLIIPTMEVASKLKPRIILLENVPSMKNTIIDSPSGDYVNIMDYIRGELSAEYKGEGEVVQFADYGVPQRRSRLITIYTRDDKLKEYYDGHKSFLPERTHSKNPDLFTEEPWNTVRDTIADLPPLDAKNKELSTSDIPYHNVPVLDEKKYFWVSNTPTGQSAFDNQCVNPECGYQGNPTHGATVNSKGINRSNKDTPLYCQKCGGLLPRPWVENSEGNKRIMSGYTSAYKRMEWDLPAPTLTTNLQYPSSDHKLHPEENRVLSLLEAFKLHTLDEYDYEWKLKNGEDAPDTLIREVIGESIPPKGLEIIFNHIF